jgi:hypothetical protein
VVLAMSAVRTAATATAVEATASSTTVEAASTAGVAGVVTAAAAAVAVITASAISAAAVTAGLCGSSVAVARGGVTSATICAEAAGSVVGRTSCGGVAKTSVRRAVAGVAGGSAITGVSGVAGTAVVAVGKGSTCAAVIRCTSEANSTRTATEAVVGTVIDVAAAPSDVVVGTVVPVVAAAPVSAVEAGAEVSEAVVNATVVADGRAPVTCVPEVAADAIAPVSRGVESACIGRSDPGAVDPLVTFAVPGPVAGGPDVTVAGSGGLVVDGDRGGRNCDRDEDACVSNCRGDEKSACESSSDNRIFEQPGELHQLTLPALPSFVPAFKDFAEWRGLRFPPGLVCVPDRALIVIRHKLAEFVASFASCSSD